MVGFIAFLGFFLLPSVPFVPVPHPVAADALSSVYVTPVQTCCILPADSSPVFSVNVMMNLNGVEPFNGFDIRLNYSNFFSPSPPAHGVVKAFSMDYSNNVFVTNGYPMSSLA